MNISPDDQVVIVYRTRRIGTNTHGVAFNTFKCSMKNIASSMEVIVRVNLESGMAVEFTAVGPAKKPPLPRRGFDPAADADERISRHPASERFEALTNADL